MKKVAAMPRNLLLGSLLFLAGCTSFIAPDNVAITSIDEDTGYRRLRDGVIESYGDTAVMLSFSGGGTRASALSYGVMQELRDSLLPTASGNVRMLDEVETISSVSGGSFTSAYYGLYREKLFEDFEKDFLRLGVQQALQRAVVDVVRDPVGDSVVLQLVLEAHHLQSPLLLAGARIPILILCTVQQYSTRYSTVRVPGRVLIMILYILYTVYTVY